MENMLCIYLYINYIKKIAPTQVVGKLYNTVKSMPQSGYILMYFRLILLICSLFTL